MTKDEITSMSPDEIAKAYTKAVRASLGPNAARKHQVEYTGSRGWYKLTIGDTTISQRASDLAERILAFGRDGKDAAKGAAVASASVTSPATNGANGAPVKRGRGRPRKDASASAQVATKRPVKGKPGRPRKDASQALTAVTVRLTDDQVSFVTLLGQGNASEGARQVIEIARNSTAQVLASAHASSN